MNQMIHTKGRIMPLDINLNEPYLGINALELRDALREEYPHIPIGIRLYQNEIHTLWSYHPWNCTFALTSDNIMILHRENIQDKSEEFIVYNTQGIKEYGPPNSIIENWMKGKFTKIKENVLIEPSTLNNHGLDTQHNNTNTTNSQKDQVIILEEKTTYLNEDMDIISTYSPDQEPTIYQKSKSSNNTLIDPLYKPGTRVIKLPSYKKEKPRKESPILHLVKNEDLEPTNGAKIIQFPRK